MPPTRGMTAAGAAALVELAKNNGRNAQVKTFDKDLRKFPGKASLLSVLNSDLAVIQPHGHGHTEVVPLSTIGLWKSGNPFDIQEVVRMEKLFNNPSMVVQPTGKSVSIEKTEYVVVSKNKGVFCGDRGWVRSASPTIQYSVYNEQAFAARAVGKLNKVVGCEDAMVLKRSELSDFLANLPPISPSPLSAQPKPAHIQGPKVIAPAETPSPVGVKPEVKIPTRPAQSSVSSLLNFDLDSILMEDNSELQKALENKRKAAEDAKAAKSMLEEALERLQQAQSEISRLTNSMTVPILGGSAPQEADDGSKLKRGALRSAIRSVLTVSSRLDAETLCSKVLGICPVTSNGSIKQALYSMRSAGLLERDDNGGWALTAEGKSSA